MAKRLAGLLGITHGFLIGVVLGAKLAKQLGWWPPSEAYLKQYVIVNNPKKNSKNE